MALLVDSGSRRLVLRTYLLLALLNIVHVAQAQQCFVGGWSLRYPGSCPQDAKKECGSAADLQLRCCPASLECVGDDSFEGNYCCPSKSTPPPAQRAPHPKSQSANVPLIVCVDGTDCQKPSYDHPKVDSTLPRAHPNRATRSKTPRADYARSVPTSRGRSGGRTTRSATGSIQAGGAARTASRASTGPSRPRPTTSAPRRR